MFKKYLLYLILTNVIYAQELKELLEYANTNNKLALSKEFLVKAKKQEVKSSQSAFMPVVDMGGFYQRLDDKTPQMAGDIYSGYAKISYNIYDGKRKSSITQQKQNELKSSQFEVTAFKKSLSLEIVKEFYTIKNIDSTISALQEKQKALNAQLQRVKKFFEANLSTSDEIDKLQSAYDTNSYNIESLKFQKLSALKELELKVGKSIKSLDNATFVKNQTNGIEKSDNIKALKYKKESFKDLAQTIGSVNLPQIDISDTYSLYGYNRVDKLHPEGLDNQNKIMLTLNLRVFDAKSTSQKKQALILTAQSLDNEIVYLSQEQKMLFDLSLSRIKTEKLKIKSASSALKSAKSTFESIEKKYKAGIVDNIAYLDALSVKTDALSLYNKSLNDLEIAYAIYYYYAGKNIEEFIR